MDNWNLWWTISLWFQMCMKSALMWKQKQKTQCYNRSNTICVSRYITLYEIENACLPVQCHRSDKLPDLLIQPFQKQSALLRKICLESKSILCTLSNSFFLKNVDYVQFKNLRTRLSNSCENFKNANQSVFLIVLYKRKLGVAVPYMDVLY